MRRFSPYPASPQLPLAFEPATAAQAESAQRVVYRRMRISSRLTFEQVMADPALAICVRNVANRRDLS